jgi:hypothetical protein
VLVQEGGHDGAGAVLDRRLSALLGFELIGGNETAVDGDQLYTVLVFLGGLAAFRFFLFAKAAEIFAKIASAAGLVAPFT